MTPGNGRSLIFEDDRCLVTENSKNKEEGNTENFFVFGSPCYLRNLSLISLEFILLKLVGQLVIQN